MGEASARPNTPRDKSGTDALWPYYAATGAYLILGFAVIYARRSEIGGLFSPADGTTGRLGLNSLGDILAGLFAPLAFLWLFAATQLQRKELRLQREELADTRAVLDEQRRELQRSAAESNAQTAIMQRTLDSTVSRSQYDTFSINLYFLAQYIIDSRIQHLIFPIGPESFSSIVSLFEPHDIDQQNASTIDHFFRDVRFKVKYASDNLAPTTPVKFNDDSPLAREDIILITRKIYQIMQDGRAMNNDLINARIEGLQLNTIFEYFAKIRDIMIRL